MRARTAWAVFFGLAAVLFGGEAGADEERPWVAVWVYPDASVFYEISTPHEPSQDALDQLERIFGSPASVSAPSGEETAWAVEGECAGVAVAKAFQVRGTIPLAVLAKVAGRGLDGTVDVELSWLDSAVYSVSWTGSEDYSADYWTYSDKVFSEGSLLPLVFEFGFPVWRVVAYPVLCGALVAALVWHLARRRNRALKRAQEDRAEAAFNYYRSSQKVFLCGVPLVLSPTLLFDPTEFLIFLAYGRWTFLLSNIGYVVVIAPVLVLAALMGVVSHAVFVEVRGAQITRKDLALQHVLSVLLWAGPLWLFMMGLGSLPEGMSLRAALFFGATPVVYMMLAGLWWRTFRVRRERLTDCALSQAIQHVAEKAGVKLKELQILTPGARLFSANAFSMHGARLVLTDTLVELLTAREVDAIAAHELAHAKLKHPERKMRYAAFFGVTFFLIYFICLGGGVFPVVSEAEELEEFVVFISGVFFCVVMWLYIGRRFEFKADAGAVELTGDPEAFITGLTKICRINYWPLEWKKRYEVLMTHPSLMRRLRAVGERAGLSPAGVESLVERGETGDSYYEVPAYVLEGDKVFSSEARRKILLSGMVLMLLLNALIPALTARAVVQWDLQGGARLETYLAGLALTALGMILVSGYLNHAGSRRFKKRLLAKLASNGVNLNEAQPTFVSYAPNDSDEMYEGFTNTDIGFLFAAGDRLCFFGDEQQFAVPRESFVSAGLGRRRRGWFRRRELVVRWREKGGDGGGSFCVSCYDVGHASSVTKANKRLIEFIRAWREGRQAEGIVRAEFDNLGLPGEPGSGGVPMRVGCGPLFTSGMRVGLLTFLLCLGLGLVKGGEPAGPVLYALSAALVAHVFFHLPYLGRRRMGMKASAEEVREENA